MPPQPFPQYMSPGGLPQLAHQQPFNFGSPGMSPAPNPNYAHFTGQHVGVASSPHVAAAPAPQDDFLHGSEKAVR